MNQPSIEANDKDWVKNDKEAEIAIRRGLCQLYSIKPHS